MIEFTDVVLQVCDPGMDFGDYMRNFEFIKAATCAYFVTAGMLVTGLLVYGGISLKIYIQTGSVIIPFVLLLTIGGAAMTQMAGIVSAFAMLLLLVAGAGAITILYKAHSR